MEACDAYRFGMNRRLTLPAVAVLLALAACTSANTRAVATPAASPSPTVSTATIAQYASKLNGPLKNFRDPWTKYEDECMLVDNPPARCALYVLTMNIVAATIQSVINGAVKPGVPAFIGQPPPELVALVAETLQDATVLESETRQPENLSDGWAGDAAKLDSDIDEWGPYLT
jgi:hypothetical protein